MVNMFGLIAHKWITSS